MLSPVRDMAVLPDDKPFRLFALPRELRDLLYRAMLMGSQTKDVSDVNCDCVTIRAKHLPESDLLVLDRQFEQEYREASSRLDAMLVVRDYYIAGIDNFTAPLLVPLRLLSLRRLELNLRFDKDQGCGTLTPRRCTGCELGAASYRHLLWTTDLIQRMPTLQYLNINIHVHVEEDVQITLSAPKKGHLARLVALSAGVAGFRCVVYASKSVLHDFDSEDWDVIDWEREKRTIMEWDAGADDFRAVNA